MVEDNGFKVAESTTTRSQKPSHSRLGFFLPAAGAALRLGHSRPVFGRSSQLGRVQR